MNNDNVTQRIMAWRVLTCIHWSVLLPTPPQVPHEANLRGRDLSTTPQFNDRSGRRRWRFSVRSTIVCIALLWFSTKRSISLHTLDQPCHYYQDLVVIMGLIECMQWYVTHIHVQATWGRCISMATLHELQVSENQTPLGQLVHVRLPYLSPRI